MIQLMGNITKSMRLNSMKTVTRIPALLKPTKFQSYPQRNYRIRINNSSFRPTEEFNSNLGGALSFTLITSGLTFGACALLYQEHLKRNRILNIEPTSISNIVQTSIQSIFNINQHKEFKEEQEDTWSIIKNEINSRIDYIKQEINSLKRHEKLIYSMIAANVTIFLLWKVPRFQPFLQTHFLHFPTSNKYYTLLTSTFSHKDLWHLALNMLAFKSFAEISGSILGAEHMFALYISSGIIAALGRRISLAVLPARYALSSSVPSLGASGAIFSLVGFTCYNFPDAQSSILFLPFIKLDLAHMLFGFMALDFIGLIRGWKAFDHFAHLLGASSGLLYAMYGKEYIWLPLHHAIIKFKTMLKRLE